METKETYPSKSSLKVIKKAQKIKDKNFGYACMDYCITHYHLVYGGERKEQKIKKIQPVGKIK